MIGWAGQWTRIPSATPLQPKNEMLIFGLRSLLMIGWAGRWTLTPSATPLQPKKWNALFWITFNFWWSARLVDGLEHHLPPLSSPKNEMLLFGLRSTSDARPRHLIQMQTNRCRYAISNVMIISRTACADFKSKTLVQRTQATWRSHPLEMRMHSRKPLPRSVLYRYLWMPVVRPSTCTEVVCCLYFKYSHFSPNK